MKTVIHPTEDKDKVLKAVRNLFDGDIRIVEIDEDYYEVRGYSEDRDSLNKIYNLIRIEQVITAVRSYMQKHLRGNKVTLIIHKQAAYVNKLSLVDSDRESPMGTITITIESDNIDEIIDWLAPEITPQPRKKHRKTSRAHRAQRKQMLKKTFK